MFVIAVVVLAWPAAALARLAVSGPAKTPLVSAALGKKVPRQCAAVYMSSKNHSWASVSFSPQRGWSARCMKYGSNGVAVLHRVQGKWHVVTDGSDFTCPIRHVPAAVSRDLRISCH
jgi:hypothetical protein